MTIDDPGAPPSDNGEFWLFGYGSLIWKPPPHFDQRIPGWVNGYVRRFWQACQDHRGTPEKPGRVVTLIERSFWATLTDPHPAPQDGKVWGVAYRIIPEKVAEVKEYLDIREINGYSIHYTAFQPASIASPPRPSGYSTSTCSSPPSCASIGAIAAHEGQHPIRTLVYIGTPDNDQFTGPQDIQTLAEHIYRSEGPSGLNRDYLLHLDTALRSLSPESGDEHITDLSNRVRAIIACEQDVSQPEKTALSQEDSDDPPKDDGLEETEKHAGH
ncbi:ChaC-like protein-domain-containing protein [Coniella lustricola]|uniref:glutathione-specific gamma-glutamylcyclotransferase n=1 Tax=Coniella lustricola TaxID=2025994 RepID=A0A2T3AH49_9PEZI|nr:ChaC-like protein-domain-containing protein [Coniella lustricola]